MKILKFLKILQNITKILQILQKTLNKNCDHPPQTLLHYISQSRLKT